MPRIYASDNEPLDFCRVHFPKSYEAAERKYGLAAWGREGPDGRGDCFTYDAEHPPYQDEDYKCETCGCTLTARDGYL